MGYHGTGVNYGGRELDELREPVVYGQGPSGLGDSQQAWQEVAEELRQVGMYVESSMNKNAAAREGAAADAANVQGLSPLAAYAQAAQIQAEFAAEATGNQADYYTTTRNGMPEHMDRPSLWPDILTPWEYFRKKREYDRRVDRATDLMNTYQSNSNSNISSMPEFTQPQNANIGMAVPGGSQVNPGSTSTTAPTLPAGVGTGPGIAPTPTGTASSGFSGISGGSGPTNTISGGNLGLPNGGVKVPGQTGPGGGPIGVPGGVRPGTGGTGGVRPVTGTGGVRPGTGTGAVPGRSGTGSTTRPVTGGTSGGTTRTGSGTVRPGTGTGGSVPGRPGTGGTTRSGTSGGTGTARPGTGTTTPRPGSTSGGGVPGRPGTPSGRGGAGTGRGLPGNPGAGEGAGRTGARPGSGLSERGPGGRLPFGAGTGADAGERAAGRGYGAGEHGPGGRGGLNAAEHGAGRGAAGLAGERGPATGRGYGGGLRGGAGAGGSAFGPMGGGARGDEDLEHHAPDYLVETQDIFRDSTMVAPPVIGDERPDYYDR